MFRNPFRKKEEVRLDVQALSKSEKVGLRSGAGFVSELTERRISLGSMERLELLYYTDGLTWSLVQKYVENIVGPGFFLEGDPEIVKECEEWMENVELKLMLKDIIKDIFVTGQGNAWLELGYSADGHDILKLRLINPKTGMDYIRDKSGNVELDENGDPVGFQQGILSKVEWRKEGIYKEGKIVWKARPGEDGRDRIAHFKLFGLGESYLGMSPLETVYHTAVRRLNVEDNIGESAFRSGGIVARVAPLTPNTEVPERQLEQLAKDLASVNEKSIFVFPDRVSIERFPSPDLSDRSELIYQLADLQCGAMGIPLILVLTPLGRMYRGDREQASIDFEFTIRDLQEDLASQIRNKLLKRLLKARGKDPDKAPTVRFRTREPRLLLHRSRTIATLARRGLIRRDPALEKKLRQELELPIDFLDLEEQEWKSKGLKPEPSKETDEGEF